jgi:hypothetical protein
MIIYCRNKVINDCVFKSKDGRIYIDHSFIEGFDYISRYIEDSSGMDQITGFNIIKRIL